MDFNELKIIEFASVLAGPMVGTFFAEMGAKVLKIENALTDGDITRQWKLPSEKQDSAQISAYYSAANWGKESLFLNLKDEKHRAEVYKLCEEADIVIANFKLGSAKKMGIDFDDLRRINPRLIYAEITGFGAKSKRPAFDLVLQAESGILYMNGEAGRQGVKMPIAFIDILAAHQLKQGILVALLQRTQSQKGARVQVSLFDAAVASLANQATNWLMAGHIPQPIGSLHPNIAPYGETFECADNQQLVLAIGNSRQFQQLCDVVDLSSLKNDERFAENTARLTNRVILAELIRPKIGVKSSAFWLSLFEEKGIPAGLIRDMQAVFELPEAQRLILEQTEKNGTKSRRVKTSIFTISDE